MALFFGKTVQKTDVPKELVADMHAHFLPGIDDGAATLADSMHLLRQLSELGYRKLVATPHVISDFYPNTPQIILTKLAQVQQAAQQENLSLELAAAAEYYLDDAFAELVNREEELLTFGDRYVLFETSFMNQPAQMDEVIFRLQSQNYKPVLAHPERYIYLQGNPERVQALYNNGVLFQVNINSLTGYYSRTAQALAEGLIDRKMVHFAGTDCHADKHIAALHVAHTKKYYRKLLDLNLLNKTL